MKLSIKQLRHVIHEALAGSQPDENYSNELVDDNALKGKSLYVDDEIKDKIKSYFKSMGLSTH